MASTLLPTKMEGTQGLEVRSWKPNLGGMCVADTYLSWGTMCVAKINRSSQFVGTLCVAEPRLGSLCVTDVTLPSSLGKLLCCRRKKANLLTNTGH